MMCIMNCPLPDSHSAGTPAALEPGVYGRVASRTRGQDEQRWYALHILVKFTLPSTALQPEPVEDKKPIDWELPPHKSIVRLGPELLKSEPLWQDLFQKLAASSRKRGSSSTPGEHSTAHRPDFFVDSAHSLVLFVPLAGCECEIETMGRIGEKEPSPSRM